MPHDESMRFLLASAPHADTFGYSMPPPGLLRLGGWLRERGVEVGLEDLAFQLARGEFRETDELADACAGLLRTRLVRGSSRSGPPVLGLSTMGATLPIAIAIAERVGRALPHVPILFGGPGVHGVDTALIERFDFITGVLRGEGEEALGELFASSPPGEPLELEGHAGFTWRAPNGTTRREPDRTPLDDLDAVAAPAWDLLAPLADYKAITGADDGLVPVDSGRGCAFDCSFCNIGRYWRRRSRCLSPARLANEIEALVAEPAAHQAYLCHDLFGADRSHALAVCAELERRAAAGRSLPFEVRARLDHLDDELVDAMAAAGCYRVLVGIESASEPVRRAANKDLRGIDTAELLRRVVHLSNAGITPILSLILGLPGEERADLAASLDFLATAAARAGRGGAQLSLHLVNPQPGCALGEEYATTSQEVAGIPPDMAFGTGLTLAERRLIEAHPDLFSSWHLLTGLPGGAEHLHMLHTISRELPELLMRYPRTHQALRAVMDQDTLELFEARHALGILFESQVRMRDHPALDALLDWEQAKLRTAARRGPWRRGTLDFPSARSELELHHEALALPVDVATLTDAPSAPHEETHFLVGRSVHDDFTSPITTRRISPDLFRAYTALAAATLDPTPPAPELEGLARHLAALEGGTLLSLVQPQS
jgi:radical SAM superfamily enzyme YgiQ (UPF0313 family)